MSNTRARRNNSTGSKIVSTGLAVATCIGVVGVIGVRSAQESAAVEPRSSTQAADAGSAQAVAVVSSSGLTQADLDAYAAALEQERVKLKKYGAKLVAAAVSLQQATAGTSAPANRAVVTTAPTQPQVNQPVSRPAPQKATQPQSNTRSS